MCPSAVIITISDSRSGTQMSGILSATLYKNRRCYFLGSGRSSGSISKFGFSKNHQQTSPDLTNYSGPWGGCAHHSKKKIDWLAGWLNESSNQSPYPLASKPTNQ